MPSFIHSFIISINIIVRAAGHVSPAWVAPLGGAGHGEASGILVIGLHVLTARVGAWLAHYNLLLF